jgi:M6 family metalloprotease-like protein
MPHNDSLNTNGYHDDNYVDISKRRTTREFKLIQRTINRIAEDVPTDLVLDSTDDGFDYIDCVNFIVRGKPGEWSNLIWPHQGSLSQNYSAQINGKYVRNYTFNIETRLNASGVGILAHEMGHILGLSDFYRSPVKYPVNRPHPIGIWDLMATETNPPQSISAYNKAKLGWIPEIPLITASGSYTLSPLTSNQPTHEYAYRINTPFPSLEYFIVEYRKKRANGIDSTIYGSGLLIYRVYTQIIGNTNGPPDELYVFRPGGSPEEDGNIINSHFSADVYRTQVSSLGRPYLFLTEGD